MARNTETVLNTKLGEALIARHPNWSHENVHIERTGTLRGHPGRKIDVLVVSAGGQPVAIEAEVEPGNNVEAEATDRLEHTFHNGEVIESAVSVIYPSHLRQGDPGRLTSVGLSYVTHQLGADRRPKRWPEDGRLLGDVNALADAVEAVSLSERLLAESANVMEQAVHDSAERLRGDLTAHTKELIATVLHQQDTIQTTRMACSIVASAFVFHQSIEGQPGIPLLSEIRDAQMSKAAIRKAWKAILEVNYWPIFAVALKVITPIPDRDVWKMAGLLDQAAQTLYRLGSTTFHDLAGRAFQTLISDRKFLATFYTLPVSACLLAELAVGRLQVDWKDSQQIVNLRIADLACGTGALLSAAQRAIYRRHRRHGGDDHAIHRSMMEHSLIGTDIMPAATHLTASILSSVHPGLAYGDSLIHTLPYGRGDWGLSIGALDLLDQDQMDSLFQSGTQMRGKGGKSKYWSASIPRGSCDLVIMNPPFTRSTGHEAKKVGVPVPSFAGFSTSEVEQRVMSDKLSRMNRECGHGNAGLASDFMDLAHRKLKPGGVLALVLPFTFNTGQAWEAARKLLDKHYKDIRVVSIATSGVTRRAFSADTGLAESLVVATKRAGRVDTGGRGAVFSNLSSRPGSILEAQVMARGISRDADQFVSQEVPSGTVVVGETRQRPRPIRGSLLDGGAAGIRDSDLAVAAENLVRGKLQLPRERVAVDIPLVQLGEVADRGLYHMDINGWTPRGPFDKRALMEGEIPTYPSLWKHQRDAERSFFVKPDSCLDVRDGCDEKAAKAWAKASRLHFSVDFGLASQSLAMCLTRVPSLGGRAWPNVLAHKSEYEEPMLLWANSTLGLVLYWWLGTRQQPGRAFVKITALPKLRVLDPRQLSETQQAICTQALTRFANREFLPANEAYRDGVRQDLDAALLVDVLGLPKGVLDAVALLRLKWCSEPSVHRGKSTRPSY